MSGMQTGAPASISVIAGMERRLASVLNQAAGEIARMETLDEEQRAEIYAILGAIQDDTEIHRAMTAALAGRLRSGADA
jgi:hypothetical protein